MNREQGRVLPASKSHGKVNVSRNGRGREEEGEEENVNVSVLDGTTCLEASHYLYDSLFILKLTRRNCDSWQGEKGGELTGGEGNRADVSSFRVPIFRGPQRVGYYHY